MNWNTRPFCTRAVDPVMSATKKLVRGGMISVPFASITPSAWVSPSPRTTFAKPAALGGSTRT